MTLANTGQGQAIIDGGGIDRVLSANSAAPGIGLVGLTIRNGAASGSGGGIADAGTVLTIRNSTFEGNHAEGEGGAIYATDNGAAIALENVTLSANSANESGGAFSSEGGMHAIRNSTITGNVADADAAGGVDRGRRDLRQRRRDHDPRHDRRGEHRPHAYPEDRDCAGQGLGSLGNNLIGDPTGRCAFFGPHPSSDLLVRPEARHAGRQRRSRPRRTRCSRERGNGEGFRSRSARRPTRRPAGRDCRHRRLRAGGLRGLVVNRVGTAGRDRLRGTSGRDGILALGGRDILKGLGGADTLCGGGGRDKLLAGEATTACSADGAGTGCSADPAGTACAAVPGATGNVSEATATMCRGH